MRHLPAVLLMIPLLAVSALGEPEHFEPVSEDALHFRAADTYHRSSLARALNSEA